MAHRVLHVRVMRIVVTILFALVFTACSREDEAHAHAQAERAKEQARQTAATVKQDSRKAFNEAREEAHKASAALNRDLEKAREKTRRALDEPESSK
jgi:hypothetical protein